jgi:hypothetical protein
VQQFVYFGPMGAPGAVLLDLANCLPPRLKDSAAARLVGSHSS